MCARVAMNLETIATICAHAVLPPGQCTSVLALSRRSSRSSFVQPLINTIAPMYEPSANP